MSELQQGQKIYGMFKAHLDNHNFHYTAHDDDLVISLTVQGEDLPQLTIIRVLADRQVVQIISPLPAHVPEDKRIDGAIAVAVANYGIVNGSFDFDMNDGEIRYRVAQGYHGVEFSDDLIGYLLRVVFLTTDKYNDRFFMLSKGLMSLEDFIAKEG